MGYSPWGRKESDTTERLYFLFLFHPKLCLNSALVYKEAELLASEIQEEKNKEINGKLKP